MPNLTRPPTHRLVLQSGAAALAGCSTGDPKPKARPMPNDLPPSASGVHPVLAIEPLDFVWPTRDPFLFCVHHDDRYPAGTEQLGPDPALLAGRQLGYDFEPKDGFRMYHGHVVPGFPCHPHRGFETVTVVRRGLLDHADSGGAAARYGGGDVQWLTAGGGIQHAEMFPLLHRDRDNPVELFQIWLNLPAADKLVQPHFAMLWRETIPTVTVQDDAGRATRVTVMAGRYAEAAAPSPPPHSWAARAEADVAIWTLHMAPGACFELPAAGGDTDRSLYLHQGERILIHGVEVPVRRCVDLARGQTVRLQNGARDSELLLLQGRPIGEPVAHHGPFVMNTRSELQRAYADYQRTQFGGWPWPTPDPVHGPREGRFARHQDGRVERPA